MDLINEIRKKLNEIEESERFRNEIRGQEVSLVLTSDDDYYLAYEDYGGHFVCLFIIYSDEPFFRKADKWIKGEI